MPRFLRSPTLGLVALLVGLVAAALAPAAPARAQVESRLFIEFQVNVVEGNLGTSSASFTVTLSPASGESVTVQYATADGPLFAGLGVATAPADYTATSGTLTFLPTETSKTIIVPVIGDALHEQHDVYSVTLSNPTNATIGSGTGFGVIINDDPIPSLTIDDVNRVEGTGGSRNAVFNVNLSAPSGQEVRVAYTTVDGAATAPADYAATSGTLVIPAGAPGGQIAVQLVTDNADEPNEPFTVVLSSAVNAVLTDDTAIGTILDDDGPPTLSINDTVVVEGNSGTTSLTFEINLQPASGNAVSVTFATANGSAVAPGDYTAVAPVVVNFPAGTTSRTVTVPVIGDTADEVTELFFGNLSSPVNATISDSQGVGFIDDDDGPVAVINDVTANEGTGGATTFTFTVGLLTASPETVLVGVTTESNTAVAPDDYAAIGFPVLTFTPGQTSRTVSVSVVADAIDEDNESFFVNIYGVADATIGDSQGVGTILDDDAPPTIRVGDANITEGNSGTASGIFTVELSAISGRTVTVNVASADGTATAGSDYTALPLTTLFFPPGTRTQNISIAVTGDTTDEDNETFFVNLSSASNAGIADGQGLGIITDDDLPPTATINDVTVTEGNSGTVNATFTVALSQPSGKAIQIDFASSDGTATTTPTPPLPVDYNACAGTLSFAPGVASRTITCQVRGDTTDEFDETFFVDLAVPAPFASTVTLADSRGVATITDDDALTAISINDVAVTEGDATVAAVFQVTLAAPSGKVVTVNAGSVDGTARAPGDYTSCGATLTFPAGSVLQTLTCFVTGDLIDEETESFFADLSSPGNATITRARGTATITDNDPPPTVRIGDSTVAEGNPGGSINAVFTVSLSAPSERQVRVTYATADGTAAAGSDYTAITPTELIFEPGVVTRNVSVPVLGDLTDEFDETFLVNLSAPVNVTIADGQGEATINDDDLPPTVGVSCGTVVEGDGGTTPLGCAITLERASAKPITVDYATFDDSAVAPDDYQATSGTLSFAAGDTSATVTVDVVGDTADEIDERFGVELSNPVNSSFGTDIAHATIDDDDGPTISVADASVTEGNSGTTAISFALTLSAASPQAIGVAYAAADGTATGPADYILCDGTASIPAGSAGVTIVCQVVGDALDEADESFTLTLSSPVDATIADGSATGTILDDDPLPALAVNDIVVGEGTSGTTSAVFTVSLSAPSGREVTVSYATADGTATAPGDYTSRTGTLTFAPGLTSLPVAVPVVGDTLNEPNESFTLTLSGPGNATIADETGEATIIDSDSPPVIGVADASVAEGNSGTTDIRFTVSISAASGRAISAQYAAAAGSATTPEDFAACAGTVSIAAGDTSAEISCDVSGDTRNEADETFTLTLSNVTNATPGDTSAVGTITNDDPEPSLSIADATVSEGDSGMKALSLTVQLNATSGQTVTVAYQSQDLTAESPADYEGCTGLLTFAPGTPSRTITCNVRGDTLDEEAETFRVTLSGATNATIADGQATATIEDNDAPPEIAILCGSIREPRGGTDTASCRVSLSTASGKTVTVGYATSGGTAAAGTDYRTRSGTLSFAPGVIERTITVDILSDLLPETTETILVRLSSPTNGTLVSAEGIISIIDLPAAVNQSVFLPLIRR